MLKVLEEVIIVYNCSLTSLCLEITLPPILEDGYPEVTEMEKYKLQVKNFILEWQTMESILAGTSSVMPTLLEIAGKTPLTLLSDAVTKIESK